MTVKQIRSDLKKAGKPLSREQTHRLLKKFGVAPAGARQRPQQYPEDSAARILAHLGLTPANTNTNGAAVPTMAQLRAEKRKASR